MHGAILKDIGVGIGRPVLERGIGDVAKGAAIGKNRFLPAVPAKCPHRAHALAVDARSEAAEGPGLAVEGQFALAPEAVLYPPAVAHQPGVDPVLLTHARKLFRAIVLHP